MGLLEKALRYKKEINREGGTTLIDKIKGPAEEDFLVDDVPTVSEEIAEEIAEDVVEDVVEDVAEDVAEDIGADFDTNKLSDFDLDSEGESSDDSFDNQEIEDVSLSVTLLEDEVEIESQIKDDVNQINETKPDVHIDVSISELTDLEILDEVSEIGFEESQASAINGSDLISESDNYDSEEEIDLFELPDDDPSDDKLLDNQNDVLLDVHIKPVDQSLTDQQDVVQTFEDDDDDFNLLGPEDEPVFHFEEIEETENVLKETTDEQVEVSEKVLEEVLEEVSEDVLEDVLEDVSIDESMGDKDQSVDNYDFEMKEIVEGIDNDIIEEEYPDHSQNKEADEEIDVGLIDSDIIEDEVIQNENPVNGFQDFQRLYEISKELAAVKTKKEFYDIILFSIMGQIGASSSSIMISNTENIANWTITDSSGITISDERINLILTDNMIRELEKDIIDIEAYKNDPDFIDQYNQFLGVDTRLICPIRYNGRIIGALILGDKIEGGDYSDEEKDFIRSVSQISAGEMNKLDLIEILDEENKKNSAEKDFSHHIYDMLEEMNKYASLNKIEEFITKEFNDQDILSYSIFIYNEKNDRYRPFTVEKEDYLSIMEEGFFINGDDPFIQYIRSLSDQNRIEMFNESNIIVNTFTESRVKKMSVFWVYPFKIRNMVLGFITIFRIRNSDKEDFIDNRLKGFSKILFPNILNIKNFDIEENKYTDHIEIIHKRISNELMRVRDSGIPLTLVLFSIKNFKRYSNLYGYTNSQNLLDKFVECIKTKLSDADFSARFDRNKILVMLSGKDKKYANTFANTVRNEVLLGFKRKEMKLLITYLTAEFPLDGEDLFSLLDNID